MLMSRERALPDSSQYRAEREALPEQLRDAFDDLVESYRFHSFTIYDRPFVSYKVLAALVREGWRVPKLP